MEITEVIRRGILTEKSAALQQIDNGRGKVIPQYTFQVAAEANKHQIKHAVEAMFNVKVVSVNTMRMPGKARIIRTRKGIYRTEARPWKKAIVTLAVENPALGQLRVSNELKKQGVAQVIISHRLQDIFQVGDRVMVLKRGENVGDRYVRNTTEHDVLALIVSGTRETAISADQALASTAA